MALETIEEGRCVQILHVGPYDDTGSTTKAIAAFCAAEGLTPHLEPYQIYLNDPRRIPPDRLKTIVRQPVTV